MHVPAVLLLPQPTARPYQALLLHLAWQSGCRGRAHLLMLEELRVGLCVCLLWVRGHGQGHGCVWGRRRGLWGPQRAQQAWDGQRPRM